MLDPMDSSSMHHPTNNRNSTAAAAAAVGVAQNVMNGRVSYLRFEEGPCAATVDPDLTMAGSAVYIEPTRLKRAWFQ